MGMDVCGINPTSKEGECFCNNIWSWHPLAEYACRVAPEITPPSEGSHGVFYPGEIEYLREQERRKIGIEIEDATWDKLRWLAADYKIAGELGLA